MTRIVVVDDEPVVAQTLGRILTNAGYEVEVCFNPFLALESILNNPAAVVLTDMCMPGLDGVGLALKIAEHQPACHVLILSGTRIPRPWGPLDFDWAPFRMLYKPIHPGDLLLIIARILQAAA